jgi:hypothetical protein
MGRTGAYDKHEICSLSKLMMEKYGFGDFPCMP